MKLEALIQMPSAWTGVDDLFGVHLFQGRVTVSDMERLDVIGMEWRRRHRGKTVELVIIYPSEARMSGDERQRMTKLIERWQHQRAASATVILATGLPGAMHRSILTGFMMMAPPPHPAKVFGTVADAVTWIMPHVRTLRGTDTEREEVFNAVSELCTAFEKRSM